MACSHARSEKGGRKKKVEGESPAIAQTAVETSILLVFHEPLGGDSFCLMRVLSCTISSVVSCATCVLCPTNTYVIFTQLYKCTPCVRAMYLQSTEMS
jgi:hypothetical protein